MSATTALTVSPCEILRAAALTISATGPARVYRRPNISSAVALVSAILLAASTSIVVPPARPSSSARPARDTNPKRRRSWAIFRLRAAATCARGTNSDSPSVSVPNSVSWVTSSVPATFTCWATSRTSASERRDPRTALRACRCSTASSRISAIATPVNSGTLAVAISSKMSGARRERATPLRATWPFMLTPASARSAVVRPVSRRYFATSTGVPLPSAIFIKAPTPRASSAVSASMYWMLISSTPFRCASSSR